MCSKWFHRTCLGFSIKEMKALAKSNNFRCITCSPSHQTPVSFNPSSQPANTHNAGGRHSITHHTSDNRLHKNSSKKPTLGIQILQLNVNGVRIRKAELDFKLAKEQPHVVCLQETRLRPSMDTPRFNRYNVAGRVDRSSEQIGGGVLILVRDDLSYEPLLNPYNGTITDPHTDCVATRIFPPFSPPITIINIYSPPARWTAGQGTQEHLLLINRLNLSPHCIITGDLNAHGSWDNHQPCDQLGSKIDDWACDNNLVIANDGSHTRLNLATGGKSTPDVTLVSNSLASDIAWKVGSSCGSDHLPIHINLVTTPSSSRQAPIGPDSPLKKLTGIVFVC